MVSIRMRLVGHNLVKNKLVKVMKNIPTESQKTIKKACIAGRALAKALAPKQTGALIRAITFRTGGKTKNAFGYVESNMPGPPRKGNTTPYHRMMHGIDKPDISHRIKTGDPKYMFKTTEFLKKHFPEQMKKAVHTAIRP